MASVQPAAAAASGGGYPPAAATMPLPPNLTKEQVQATLVVCIRFYLLAHLNSRSALRG